ncbi:MAG: hypothetical protein E7254_07425 [Lachnospiraceae bacterium]|nr:hypothetical protein [Lachnospiraceae bacterium]
MKNEMKRKIVPLLLSLSLVIPYHGSRIEKIEADDTVSGTINNFVVEDYYKYTGKYLLYFSEVADSSGYNLYIDEANLPVKKISGTGNYLSKEDLKDVEEGSHTLRIVRINKNGVEKEYAETTIVKQDYEELFTDIPQVYIYTDDEITKEYHEDADVTISLVDREGGQYKDIIDGQCNIKIRGNSTAVADKKPWNIKFSSKTNVLGMGRGKKWCLLSNAYDKSLMRNKLAYDFGRATGLKYTSDSRYVEVYINGKYNGSYQMTVPVEVKKERINIDAYNANSNDILLELGTRYESDVNHFKTNVLGVMFDVNDPEKEGDLDSALVINKIGRVKEYLNEFESALVNGEYSEICNYIDVDSFVDMYVAYEFFKNADFNFSSTRFYIYNDKIFGGPLWDFDLSCGNYNPRTYSQMYEDGESYKGIFCNAMPWYAKLLECEEFQELVKERFAARQYIIQNMYKIDSPAKLSIDNLIENYGKSFERDSAKTSERGAGWSLRGGGGYVGIGYTTTAKWTQWEQPIEFVREWLKNRNEWLCEYWGIDMEEAYQESELLEIEEETTEYIEETTEHIVETTEIVGTTNMNTEATAVQMQIATEKKEETLITEIKVPTVKISYARKKKAKQKVTVKLKKRYKGVDGFEVAFYSKKSRKNKYKIFKTTVTSSKISFTVRNRKFEKIDILYVSVRGYKLNNNEKIYSSKWSGLVKIKA